MANTIPSASVFYDGDGTTTQYPVTFEYLDKAYVFATVDGADAAFTWTTDNTVEFTTAPAAGTQNVNIYRTTEADAMLAVFSEDTPFLPKYVDKDYTQLLHLIQEANSGSIDRDDVLQDNIDAEAAARAAADTSILSAVASNFARTLRTPDSVGAMTQNAAARANKALTFGPTGNPVATTPASGSAADVLIELAKSTGASLVGTEHGGTLAQAVPYATLEGFGGGTGVADNGAALQAFANAAAAGGVAVLRLGIGTYTVVTPVTFTTPVSIIGYGALHGLLGSTVPTSDSIQQYGSILLDGRTADSATPLLEFTNGAYSVLGVGLQDLEVVGANRPDSTTVANTVGVRFSNSGWTNSVSNVIFRDFGREGLILRAVNDGVWNNVQVLRCGGYDSTGVHYALDMYPADSTTSKFNNQNRFIGCHFEHNRYTLRLSGYFNSFWACHFELNDSSFTPGVEVSPVIQLVALTYPVSFMGCNFVSPDTRRYLDGFTDVSDLAANLAATPYFIAGTSGSVISSTSDSVRVFCRFQSCDFTIGSGVVKWMDIPDIRTFITGCHITRCAGFANALRLGTDSHIESSVIYVAPLTNDTSAYASLVNGVYTNPVYGYGHLVGSNVQFLGGSASYACFNPANSGGSARTRLTNIARGTYGYTVGVYTGDYIDGYVGGYNGVYVQDSSARTALISGIRLLTSTSAFGLQTASYSTNQLAIIGTSAAHMWAPNNETGVANLGGAGNRWDAGWFKYANITSTGILPESAGARVLGSTTYYWRDIYSQNAVTVVSDRTHKTYIGDIPDEVLDAWGTVQYSQWKLKAAVAEKGEADARWHVGIVAQEIQEKFQAAGLDATDYGLLIHQEWSAADAVTEDVDGTPIVVTPAQAAGSIWMVRESECHAMEAAYIRRALTRAGIL